MSSQTGTWLIAVGAIAASIGIIMLPAALGEHPDTSLLDSGRVLPVSGLSDRSLGCLFEGARDSTPQRTKRGIGRIQELKPTSPRRL